MYAKKIIGHRKSMLYEIILFLFLFFLNSVNLLSSGILLSIGQFFAKSVNWLNLHWVDFFLYAIGSPFLAHCRNNLHLLVNFIIL